MASLTALIFRDSSQARGIAKEYQGDIIGISLIAQPRLFGVQ
jgi:hypothetical protein